LVAEQLAVNHGGRAIPIAIGTRPAETSRNITPTSLYLRSFPPIHTFVPPIKLFLL